MLRRRLAAGLAWPPVNVSRRWSLTAVGLVAAVAGVAVAGLPGDTSSVRVTEPATVPATTVPATSAPTTTVAATSTTEAATTTTEAPLVDRGALSVLVANAGNRSGLAGRGADVQVATPDVWVAVALRTEDGLLLTSDETMHLLPTGTEQWIECPLTRMPRLTAMDAFVSGERVFVVARDEDRLVYLLHSDDSCTWDGSPLRGLDGNDVSATFADIRRFGDRLAIVPRPFSDDSDALHWIIDEHAADATVQTGHPTGLVRSPDRRDHTSTPYANVTADDHTTQRLQLPPSPDGVVEQVQEAFTADGFFVITGVAEVPLAPEIFHQYSLIVWLVDEDNATRISDVDVSRRTGTWISDVWASEVVDYNGMIIAGGSYIGFRRTPFLIVGHRQEPSP